tara:strand:+ start:243 stop:617 length:375 start_codon:yes stop_codon:yes gene_type:complete
MNKEKFFAELKKAKSKTNLKSHKVALGSMDDMLGEAKDILSHAETEMPERLRDWRNARSAADDFGVEVNFEASLLEEDLDILAMKLEDLGLSPSDIGIYQDVIQIIEKLHTITDDAFGELDSGM